MLNLTATRLRATSERLAARAAGYRLAGDDLALGYQDVADDMLRLSRKLDALAFREAGAVMEGVE